MSKLEELLESAAVLDYIVDDLIENYKYQENPEIQEDISQRLEFKMLESDKKEKVPKLGEFFKHQNIIKRFMRNYDKIFMIHETGTGKTASVINLTEFYKENKDNIKKAIILEPGPPTVDDFKEQILKLTLKDLNSKNKETRFINKFYEITTYQKFYKENLSVSKIEEYYNDSIFFLDEIHKLRNLSDSSGGIIKEEYLDKIYNYLWKVLHVAKRIKIVLGSATPMVNSIKDFVPLMNLILDKNEQLPLVKEDEFYDSLTINQLEPYFRGKISFVRFLENDVLINNKGDTMNYFKHEIMFPKKNLLPIHSVSKIIEKEKIVLTPETKKFEKIRNQPVSDLVKKTIPSQIKIYQVELKNIQLQIFKKVSQLKKDSFYKEARQASLFVFPDGSYGKKGFEKYIELNEFNEYRFRKNLKEKINVKPGLGNYFNENEVDKSLKNLESLSCKYTDFVSRELKRSKEDRPGNCFCYIEQVEGSGAILLGLLLEKFGFENFTSNDSTLVNKKTNIIRPNFEKKKRFALLTGSSNNLRNSLRVFNSISNIDGEYIQILIGSEVVRDGINVKNVVRGYILSPGWHESGMYQALSRFVRATSHEDLKIRKLEESRKEGKILSKAIIKIDVYKMAAVFPKEYNEISIDLKNYIKSEEKDIKIKRILRIMKECSVDAYLNYNRNFREKDVSFTKETDYSDKVVKLWSGPYESVTSKSIQNTFNTIYIDTYYKDFLTLLFNKIIDLNYITTDEFINFIPRKTYVTSFYQLFLTLYKYIINKEKKLGKENIISYNIKNFNNTFILERSNIRSKNTKNLTTEKNFIFQLNLPNLEKQKEGQKTDYSNFIETIEKMNTTQIVDYYDRKQNYEDFKYLIEYVLIKINNGEKSNLTNNIYKLFQNYILEINIPVNWLEESNKAIQPKENKKQGRTRGEGSVAGLKDVDLSKINPGYSEEKTFIHFYRASEKTGFNITSIIEGKKREIRILEDGKFRDTNNYEEFVYRYMFDRYYDKIMKKFREAKYYGSYIHRGGEQIKEIVIKRKEFFRIVDTENPRNKGRVCYNNDAEEILKFLKYIDREKEYKRLYNSKFKKGEVCEILKELFKKYNLLFVSL